MNDRDAEAGFGAVEIGDNGVGQKFRVAGAELDVFEDEFDDLGQGIRDLVAELRLRTHGSRGSSPSAGLQIP